MGKIFFGCEVVGGNVKIQSFEIENFKGIKKARIDISDSAPGNISALIGLNESGKTTILEALSFFVTGDAETANLVETVHEKSELIDLIPKDRKSAFTGTISVQANVILEESDVDHLKQTYKSIGFSLGEVSTKNTLIIKRNYKFRDSSHIETRTVWGISFKLKSGASKSYSVYSGLPSDEKEAKDLWAVGIKALHQRLPKTVYFPTFLFNFPDKIYLNDSDDKINSYYRNIIQDVVASQGDGVSIDAHIVGRIERIRSKHANNPNFLSLLLASDEKKQIDAVLQKASMEMSQMIFGSWDEIFGRKVTGKRVQINWMLDLEKNNAPYVEVLIVDGESTYSLSERSLGFRWFFSFLLFTQFRANRKTEAGTIFLFDEPASNLHSRAQMKLLDSFAKIARGRTYIIYSTHSHYLINPRWLERAYIVKNEATDFGDDDDFDFYKPKQTNISSIKYKTFVGSYPKLTTYFQPVLDALDVSFSPLIRSKNALIVEGKFDYHPLLYFTGRMCEPGVEFNIFPATGSGAIAPLISLFRGWGVEFRILLDGDSAGRKEKLRYIDEYFVKEGEVKCLSEFGDIFDNKALEAAYQNDVVSEVRQHFGVEKIKKSQFALYFQEIVARGASPEFLETEQKLRPLVDWINAQFSSTSLQ